MNKKKKKYEYDMGDVIYLKNQEDILYTYDEELKHLIDTHHRFVVITYTKKYSHANIALLSTSKYLNKDNEMGLLLKGNYSKYGNGKDLYIDYTSVWCIRNSFIKEKSYKLETIDWLKLAHISAYRFKEIKKGVIDHSILNGIQPLLQAKSLMSLNVEQRLNQYKQFIDMYIFYTTEEDCKNILLEFSDEKGLKEAECAYLAKYVDTSVMYHSILQYIVDMYRNKPSSKFIPHLYAYMMRGYKCKQDYKLYEKEILLNEQTNSSI